HLAYLPSSSHDFLLHLPRPGHSIVSRRIQIKTTRSFHSGKTYGQLAWYTSSFLRPLRPIRYPVSAPAPAPSTARPAATALSIFSKPLSLRPAKPTPKPAPAPTPRPI